MKFITKALYSSHRFYHIFLFPSLKEYEDNDRERFYEDNGYYPKPDYTSSGIRRQIESLITDDLYEYAAMKAVLFDSDGNLMEINEKLYQKMRHINNMLWNFIMVQVNSLRAYNRELADKDIPNISRELITLDKHDGEIRGLCHSESCVEFSVYVGDDKLRYRFKTIEHDINMETQFYEGACILDDEFYVNEDGTFEYCILFERREGERLVVYEINLKFTEMECL